MKKIFSDYMNRTFAVVFGFVALTVVFSCYLLYYGAVFHGVNEKGDALKESIAKKEMRAATVEGSIVDSRGDVITYAEEPGVSAKCVNVSYSQLVGFNSSVYGSYGLRGKYADALFTGDKNHHGATLALTTVNQLQNAAYQEIRGTEGCVVILENATGRVLALATAYPGVEMDVNDLASNWSEMNAPEHDGFLIQNWRKALAPGSTMKPLTATLVYDEGLSDVTYQDTGSEKIGGYTFRNAGKAVNGAIRLNGAIVKSCNTYFAHMTNEMGQFKLQERAEAFYVGKKLELDFGTISSSHHLFASTAEEVAAAGFGQGQLLLTPVNMAIIGQTIANGGEVKKPYLIDSISNAKGVSYQGATEVLGTACTPEAAAYVSDAMLDAAASYGIDKKLGIHAKTGTAQVNGTHRASFVSFNDKYTVCIVENNTGKAGKNLTASAVRLYKVLDGLS